MKRFVSILFLLAIIASVVPSAFSAGNNLANSDPTVSISTSANTMKLDQSTAAANNVDTDVMGTGIIGSSTKTVGLTTPVSIGTLTTGTTRVCVVCLDGAGRVGDSGIALNKGIPLASGTAVYFNVSTTTPTMYFLHDVGTCSVHITHMK